MRSCLTCFALLLLTPGPAHAQAALQLEYSFTEADIPNPDLLFKDSIGFGVRKFIDGLEQAPSVEVNSLRTGGQFNGSFSAVLNDGATIATFLGPNIDFVAGPSVIIEDEFDLGGFGIVPFRVTVTDATVVPPPVPGDADLLPDQSLAGHFRRPAGVEFHVTGAVEILGEQHPFAISSIGDAGIMVGRGSRFTVVGTDVEFRGFVSSIIGCSFASSCPIVSVPFAGGILELHFFAGGVAELQLLTAPTPPFDTDGDGVFDVFDNCESISNSDQTDSDGSGVGDACNDAGDPDGDEYENASDVCPNDFDPSQGDLDGDGVGDACDLFPLDPNNDLAQCEVDLAECDALRTFVDTDGDGEDDSTDACPGTAMGAPVDDAGCSLGQFCGAIDPNTKVGGRICRVSDWRNDEPLSNAKDCVVQQQGGGVPALCVPVQ